MWVSETGASSSLAWQSPRSEPLRVGGSYLDERNKETQLLGHDYTTARPQVKGFAGGRLLPSCCATGKPPAWMHRNSFSPSSFAGTDSWPCSTAGSSPSGLQSSRSIRPRKRHRDGGAATIRRACAAGSTAWLCCARMGLSEASCRRLVLARGSWLRWGLRAKPASRTCRRFACTAQPEGFASCTRQP